MNVQVVNEGLERVGDYLNAAQLPTVMLLGLYTTDLAADITTVYADMIQPTFAGYAETLLSNIQFNFDATNNRWVFSANEVDFAPTSTGSPVTIYGWYLCAPTAPGSGGKSLLCYQRLSVPVVLTGPTDTLPLTPSLAIQRP